MSETQCVVCNSGSELEMAQLHSSRMECKASLTWTISNYSKCNLNCGEFLISLPFGISGKDKKFNLVLYPQGLNEASKEYTSVYIRSDSDDEVSVSFTIAIVCNGDRNADVSRFDHVNSNFQTFRGWDKFIPRKDLCYFCSQDELTLSCVVVTSSSIMCNFHCVVCDSGIWTMRSRRSLSVVGKGFQTLTISDFSKCDLKEGDALVSSEFGISGMETKFYFKLYPRGLENSTGEFIAVFLYSDTDDEITVRFVFFVHNIEDRNSDFTKFVSRHGNFREGWGIWNFISRDELLIHNRHLLPNDQLTLSCVVNVTDHSDNEKLKKITLYNNVGDNDNDALIQAWSILKDNKFTDVVMKPRTAKMSAPKFLLKAFSAVFASMLRDLKYDTDATEYDNVMNEMVSLTRHFDDVDFRLKLLLTAHRRNILELRTECIEYLTVRMSKSNVIYILIVADYLRDQELHAKCLDHIGRRLLTKTFLSICQKNLTSYPKLVEDIFELFTKQQDHKII